MGLYLRNIIHSSNSLQETNYTSVTLVGRQWYAHVEKVIQYA